MHIMRPMWFRLLVLLTTCKSAHTTAIPPYNHLGRVPIRGYQSWNDLGAHVSEALLKQRADSLVSSGLAALGYTYICIDDIWASANRDPQTSQLVPDIERFPNGMKAVSDYMHSRGLKFGLYTALGNHTCSHKQPGSYGHTELDAATFAAWDIDLLKVDTCIDVNADHPLGDKDLSVTIPGFSAWSRELKKAAAQRGREIYYSICSGSASFPASSSRLWGNSWRIGMDTYRWQNYLSSLQSATFVSQYAGNGGWSDLDMLGDRSYTSNQKRSQFSLNALLGSPLLLSMDVSSLSDFDLLTYSNEEVLAISADTLAEPGMQVWGGQVKGAGEPGSTGFTVDGVQLVRCSRAVGGIQFDAVDNTIVSSNGNLLDLGPADGGNVMGCFSQLMFRSPKGNRGCCRGIVTPNSTSAPDIAAADNDRNITCQGETGINYDGADLHSFTGANATSCCAACRANPDCAVWVICVPQANGDCADMRCWLKGHSALAHRQSMIDRMSMAVHAPSTVCPSQRWMPRPVATAPGVSGLQTVMLQSELSPQLCVVAVAGSAVGLLDLDRCNATNTNQRWHISANGTLSMRWNADGGERCLSAPLEGGLDDGTTVWAKRMAAGRFAVAFFNQNEQPVNISCPSECMDRIMGPEHPRVLLQARDVWRHSNMTDRVNSKEGFVALVNGSDSVSMFVLTPTA